jgi:RimK family alpha-L-glutamate ligase
MKILILTAEKKNFVPVELLKAAQAAGIEASIIDITKLIIREELGASMLYLMDEEAGLSELKIDDETVVVPRLNEHHLDTKIGILKKMQNMGAKLLNTADSMELCNDKLMTQIVLNNAGIATPASWVIQDADGFDMAVKALEERKLLGFPIIVKTFRGTHGIGVMKLDSSSSLVSVGQTLLKEGIDFMLQEFCKHEQSARIIMIGNEVLASNLRGQPKDKDEFRTNSHLGSETQPYEPSAEEIYLAQKIVGLFGCNFCAIDYIVVDNDASMLERAMKPTAGSWWMEGADGTQKSQLTSNSHIVILEVNGSPGLEAIQKNWPDRNLAAEVIEYATSMTKGAGAIAADNPSDAVAVEKPQQQLNLIERCIIHRVIEDGTEAKVDTGAKTSSLHVDKIHVEGQLVSFTRGDTTYRVPLHDVRHVKSHDNNRVAIERPIVLLDVTIKGIRVNSVEFSLINRSHMAYEVLVGRNIIEQLGLPIIIAPPKIEEPVAEPEEAKIEVEEE